MLQLYTLAIMAIYMTSNTLAGSIGGGYTYVKPTAASGGYSYEKPSGAADAFTYQKVNLHTSAVSNEQHFPTLPTIKPLPPLPSLPALPTPRAGKGSVHQQAIFQTHPTPTSAQHSSVDKIVQQYRPASYGGFKTTVHPTLPSYSHGTTILGSFYPTTASPATGLNGPLESQPLRIPFGKSAVIHYPSATGGGDQDLYGPGIGREIKQYAVVELIDNDIAPKTEPFLSAPVRNEYRAQFGASGTGATVGGGIQLGTRANINVLEQQRLALPIASDSIALGSGGLGFIRLANGNVYLGSGSLGYISGQQLSQNVNEARTRSEHAQPDAVHFGHGALGGGMSSFNRVFKFR